MGSFLWLTSNDLPEITHTHAHTRTRTHTRARARIQVIPLQLQSAQALESLILTGNQFSNASEARDLLWGPRRIGKMNLPHGALPKIRVLQIEEDN